MSPIINQDKQVQPCPIPQAAPAGTEVASEEDKNVVLPPGLRPDTLTAQEAQTMRQLLDDPNQPRYEGREMPTADPSVLLKKAR